MGFRVGPISAALLVTGLCCAAGAGAESTRPRIVAKPVERQITNARNGHILTNTSVWSPDGQASVYDVRSTLAGDQFDGERIELVDIRTGEVRVLHQARHGAHCGVAIFHPGENKVVFILGPDC